jgi:hypothetical protein
MGRSLQEMQARQVISAGRDNFQQLTTHLQAVGLAVRWVAVPSARPGEKGPMFEGGDRCFEWSCYNASRLTALMLKEYEAIDRQPLLENGKKRPSRTQPFHLRRTMGSLLNHTRLSSPRKPMADGST